VIATASVDSANPSAHEPDRAPGGYRLLRTTH